jgi:hypothetical protein
MLRRRPFDLSDQAGVVLTDPLGKLASWRSKASQTKRVNLAR